MEEPHYLGYEQPVGEHLKYLVWAQETAGGVPGVEFGAAAPGEPGPVHRLEWRSTAAQHPLDRLQYPVSDSAVGSSARTWPRISSAAWPARSRRTGSASTGTRSIFWKPSSIRNDFAGPVIGRPTGCVLGRTTGRGKDDQTHRPNRSIKEVLGLSTDTAGFASYCRRVNEKETSETRGSSTNRHLLRRIGGLVGGGAGGAGRRRLSRSYKPRSALWAM